MGLGFFSKLPYNVWDDDFTAQLFIQLREINEKCNLRILYMQYEFLNQHMKSMQIVNSLSFILCSNSCVNKKY